MKLSIILGKIGTSEEFIQQAYKKFSARVLDTHKTDIIAAKQDFREIGDMFVRTDRLDNFCNETFKLSEQLKTRGQTKISDLLINELGKICVSFNKPEKAEMFLNLAIENCRRKNDGLHELARLIDLEKVYKSLNNKKMLINVLGRKKDCCKRIIKNYDENAANFDSINKAPTPKEEVQVQLAFAYSDLASILAGKKPYDAIKMYEKSREIYTGLNRPNEVAYLEKRINRMQEKYKSLSANFSESPKSKSKLN